MNLESAKRVDRGWCAPIADTIERLESALADVYTIRYNETRVAEGLYWGALDVDELAFPPMGKGTTAERCKAATLVEAAEWLALRRITYRSHEETMPEPISVADMVSHVPSVVPERLETLEAMQKWVEGYSLVNDRPVSVPLAYVHFISGTNGLAGGNVIEEAITQGIYEIFERRAAITVVKNRMPVPTIDPESIDHPVLRGHMDAMRERGIGFTIKDVSFGGALPCVGVYFRDPDIPERFQASHLFKVGAHEDRIRALISCFTEYAQVARLNECGNPEQRAYERLLRQADTDNFLPLFWFGYVPWTDADFLEQGDVVPFDEGAMPEDCLDDIDRARTICEQLQKDLVVVDLTDPRIGFPVVQVVIPGYSDILPYHPAGSRVLFEGWTRSLPMGYSERADGETEPCSATGFFPEW